MGTKCTTPSMVCFGTCDTNSDCYYKVLGLTKNADSEEIKKAYKKAAAKTHPDRAKANRLSKEDAEQAFKNVSEAYGVLSDADKKSAYDMYGKQGPEQGPASGFGGSTGFGGGGEGEHPF